MTFNTKNIITIYILSFLSSTLVIGMERGDMPFPFLVKEMLVNKQLASQCAFLTCVHADNHDSVKWMLENHPIPEGKDPLEYFSIPASDFFPKEYLTPMTVAHLSGRNSMIKDILLPLSRCDHTATSSSDNILDKLYNYRHSKNTQAMIPLLNQLDKPYLINGPQGVSFFCPVNKLYPLYLSACSSNRSSFPFLLKQSNLNLLNPKDFGGILFLLRIIIMNNDIRGLSYIKKLIFNNEETRLNSALAQTFNSVFGYGDNITEDDIKQFINYPILRGKKQLLLLEFNTVALAAFFVLKTNQFNNPQWQMAEKILREAVEAEQKN